MPNGTPQYKIELYKEFIFMYIENCLIRRMVHLREIILVIRSRSILLFVIIK